MSRGMGLMMGLGFVHGRVGGAGWGGAWGVIVAAMEASGRGEAGDVWAEADVRAARETYDDPHRFREIYERHYEVILNYLYRRTGDVDVAADLASQVFVGALQWLRSHRAEGLRVRPWLYRIATNGHLKWARSQRRWVARIPFVGAEFVLRQTMADLASGGDDDGVGVEDLSRVLRELPERYRTPVMLRYYEELSFREIGLVLGIGESSARSRVSRALRKLERLLGGGS